MNLYKRIPTTWWQRVWFKFRPDIVWDIALADIDYFGKKSYTFQDKKHGNCVSSIEWFEANYEPVVK